MKKKVMRWIPLVVWCCIIFFFSQQNGQESEQTSRLVEIILQILGINVDEIFKEMATLIVRKTAHFTEYFILCTFMHYACYKGISIKKAVGISFVFTALYAVTDEVHQYFIPGRTCAVRDVLIDSAGGAAAAIAIYLIRNSRARRKRNL